MNQAMRAKCGLPEPPAEDVGAPPVARPLHPPPPAGPQWTTIRDQKGQTYSGFMQDGMGTVTPFKGGKPCSVGGGFINCR